MNATARFTVPIGRGRRVLVVLVIDLRAWALWWFRQTGRYPIFATSFGPFHLWSEIQSSREPSRKTA